MFYKGLYYFFPHVLQLNILSGVWHAESDHALSAYSTRKVTTLRGMVCGKYSLSGVLYTESDATNLTLESAHFL